MGDGSEGEGGAAAATNMAVCEGEKHLLYSLYLHGKTAWYKLPGHDFWPGHGLPGEPDAGADDDAQGRAGGARSAGSAGRAGRVRAAGRQRGAGEAGHGRAEGGRRVAR